jgi:hypothetical protein
MSVQRWFRHEPGLGSGRGPIQMARKSTPPRKAPAKKKRAVTPKVTAKARKVHGTSAKSKVASKRTQGARPPSGTHTPSITNATSSTQPARSTSEVSSDDQRSPTAGNAPTEDESSRLNKWFDNDGLFLVPQDVSAKSWADAQRFAAKCLDASQQLKIEFLKRYGNFMEWPSKAIELARDVHDLAIGAVRVATLGETTLLRSSWENVTQHIDGEVPFADCMRLSIRSLSDIASHSTRARIAYLAFVGCHGVESNVRQAYPNLGSPGFFLSNPFKTERKVPEILLSQLEEARRTAAFISTLPVVETADVQFFMTNEGSREVTPIAVLHEDLLDVATRVSNVIAGLLAECRKGALTPKTEVKIDGVRSALTPGGYGFNSATMERLASEVEASCPEQPVEAIAIAHVEENQRRAGAAFLLAATIMDWGPEAHKVTYEEALQCAQNRADGFDHRAGRGETSLLSRRRKSIYHGLNELGYIASSFADGVTRKPKKKGSKPSK